MSLDAGAPLPRWLEGQRDRYREIITKERRLFKLSLLWRLGLLGVYLALQFSGLIRGISTAGHAIIFMLLLFPGIPMPFRDRHQPERKKIQQYFAREGMRIFHDMTLEVHVE